MTTAVPFFIVGCGRSGTTLLRILLNRHPDVAVPLESLFTVDYLRTNRPWSELRPLLVQEPELTEWGLSVTEADLAGVDSPTEAIVRLHELFAEQHDKRVWGQKTPRHVRHLELLAGAFPGARLIHMVRDPRAVVSSLIRSDVHQSNACYGARRWQRDVSAGLGYEAQRPHRTYRMSYEKLVQDTELEMECLADFLGIEWLPGWWRNEASALEDYSKFYDQIHAKLDRPMSADSVARWRDHLNELQVRTVEAITASQMVELGYDPVYGPAPLPRAFVVYCRLQRLYGLGQQLIKYLRQRRAYLLHLVRRKWRLGLLREFLWNVNY